MCDAVLPCLLYVGMCFAMCEEDVLCCYVLLCVLPCAAMSEDMLLCSAMCEDVLLCSAMCEHVLICVSMCDYMLL